MDNNNYVTRQEFDLFKQTTERRLLQIENTQEEISKTVNNVNTDTRLIIQKLDLLMTSNGETIKILNNRIDRQKERTIELSNTVNEHINVNPRKEYKKLTQQIVLMFISSLMSLIVSLIALLFR